MPSNLQLTPEEAQWRFITAWREGILADLLEEISIIHVKEGSASAGRGNWATPEGRARMIEVCRRGGHAAAGIPRRRKQ